MTAQTMTLGMTMIKRLLYAEALTISLLLGIHWHSWLVFGGMLLGLSVLVFFNEMIVVFALLVSAFWLLIVGQIFSHWGGETAFVLTGVTAFLVSCVSHFEAVKKSKMDKNRQLLGGYFTGNIPGAEQIRKISEKVKECVKSAGQSIKEGKLDSKSVHSNPYTRDPDQRNYGREYNPYDDSTGHPDDDD